jgi:hypothetical protein
MVKLLALMAKAEPVSTIFSFAAGNPAFSPSICSI